MRWQEAEAGAAVAVRPAVWGPGAGADPARGLPPSISRGAFGEPSGPKSSAEPGKVRARDLFKGLCSDLGSAEGPCCRQAQRSCPEAEGQQGFAAHSRELLGAVS